ncbi:MAG: hypothetical protein U5R30_01125 [Deltaproteobacteria bacterium]|nr:hypothetical protein [Deltaproteobacteria bacterium]
MIFDHKERRENAQQKATVQVDFGRLQLLFGHQILLNALHLVDRQFDRLVDRGVAGLQDDLKSARMFVRQKYAGNGVWGL